MQPVFLNIFFNNRIFVKTDCQNDVCNCTNTILTFISLAVPLTSSTVVYLLVYRSRVSAPSETRYTGCTFILSYNFRF